MTAASKTVRTDQVEITASGATFFVPVILSDAVTFDDTATFDGAVTFNGTITPALATTGHTHLMADITDLSIGTTEIEDAAVTYAKIQDVASMKVLGRTTAGAGAVEEIGLGNGLQFNAGDLEVDESALNIGAPTGSVLAFAGTSAPTGWLLCYGQPISRTTYATLFSAIGTTYGVGDGSTTFNVPDLRGRSLFGKDDMGGSAASRITVSQKHGVNGSTLGAAGGVSEHALVDAEIPDIDIGTFLSDNPSGTGSGFFYPSAADTNDSQYSINNGGGDEPHTNMPPFMIMNHIIKT